MKVTKQELEKHIKDNIGNRYGASIVIGAFFKKIYGCYPKIGLSGCQAECIDTLVESMPDKLEVEVE